MELAFGMLKHRPCNIGPHGGCLSNEPRKQENGCTSDGWRKHSVLCVRCDGLKRVHGENDEPIPCPACDAKGKVYFRRCPYRKIHGTEVGAAMEAHYWATKGFLPYGAKSVHDLTLRTKNVLDFVRGDVARKEEEQRQKPQQGAPAHA